MSGKTVTATNKSLKMKTENKKKKQNSKHKTQDVLFFRLGLCSNYC